MFQDMDWYIYFVRMLCLLDNQCSIRIRVYNLDKDLLYTQECMCKYRFHYKQHLDHMEMDCKDHHEEVLLLNLHKNTTNKLKWKRKFHECNFLRGGGFGLHRVNGSPVYWSIHEQIGVWFITSHWAFKPQEPGQGSRHFSFIHALLLGHSELIVHSGRQFGGDPI